jgi:PAS domain S-box-containing protein
VASYIDRGEAAGLVSTFLDQRTLKIPDRLLDLLPVGVYVCDRSGLVVRYNRMAAELWGCPPDIGGATIRYSGAHRLYRRDGEYVPHARCSIADVLVTGQALRDHETVIERQDGTRIVALETIESIKDCSGVVIGVVNVFREKPAQRVAQLQPNVGGFHSDELLLAFPAAVYTTDAAGKITSYNDAAAELWGLRPELGTGEFCGSWKLYWPDGTPMPLGECPMALSLKERRPIRGMEVIAERPDGTRVRFIPYPTPLFDASGILIGAVNMLLDITERREVEERLRYLAAVVEFSEDAILTKDLDGIITSWNQGAERLFGYLAEETIGKLVTILIPTDRQDEEPAILARIRRGERVEHYETIRQRKDGSFVDISLTISPVRNPEGTIIGASKIARDITERRRAEERQRLLLREMDHRVKNLFALSSGVVSLSARSAKTPEELSSAVQTRLAALARAHALTLAETFDDGERTARPATTLHELIRTILSPYDAETDTNTTRAVISGPNIPLTCGPLTSFALLLHEFATNAAKYGALSVPSGHIAITCSEEDDQFVMIWTEHGGPQADRQTDTEGFGTLLARATVKRQLGWDVHRRRQGLPA